MTGRKLLGVFIIALVLMVALFWPLRLALGNLDWEAHRLSAGEVTGTLWRGAIRDAGWRGVPLGDVAVAVHPLAWLTGTHRTSVRSAGASASLLRGRTQGIESLHGELPVLRVETMPGLEFQLRFADATLTFAEGRCHQATGAMQVEVHLPEPAGTLAPILLQGELACENLSGVVALVPVAESTPGSPDIQADLRIDADGSYRIQTQVDATDPAMRLLLQSTGFQDSPAGLSRIDSGSLLD